MLDFFIAWVPALVVDHSLIYFCSKTSSCMTCRLKIRLNQRKRGNFVNINNSVYIIYAYVIPSPCKCVLNIKLIVIILHKNRLHDFGYRQFNLDLYRHKRIRVNEYLHVM